MHSSLFFPPFLSCCFFGFGGRGGRTGSFPAGGGEKKGCPGFLQHSPAVLLLEDPSKSPPFPTRHQRAAADGM